MIKKIFLFFFLFSISVFSQSLTYQIDKKKSRVEWKAKKFVFFFHYGTIQLEEGFINLQNNQITSGKFVLDMTTINILDLKGEDKADLEAHFQEENFFHVKKYPKAIFTLLSSKKIKDNLFEIEGKLNIKNKASNIKFEAEINDDFTIAKAKFKINKNKWDIAKNIPIISKKIEFTLNIKVKKG